jgi:hypothetical protein
LVGLPTYLPTYLGMLVWEVKGWVGCAGRVGLGCESVGDLGGLVVMTSAIPCDWSFRRWSQGMGVVSADWARSVGFHRVCMKEPLRQHGKNCDRSIGTAMTFSFPDHGRGSVDERSMTSHRLRKETTRASHRPHGIVVAHQLHGLHMCMYVSQRFMSPASRCECQPPRRGLP